MGLEPLTPARRREMTREHLLEAAAVVFARRGFHGASLDEVAAMAGFTKGAVYSNFEGKDDLFLALFDDRFERQREAIEAELGEPDLAPGQQLARMADLIFGFLWDDHWNALYLEFVVYALRNPDARAKLTERSRQGRAMTERIIGENYARAGVEPDHPVAVLAFISLALFSGLGVERLIDPAAVTRDTLTAALAFMYDTIAVPDA